MAGVVNGAVAQIKVTGFLQADGANFRDCFCAMERIAQDQLEDCLFFHVPCVCNVLEQMACRIMMRVAVDPSLADKLFNLDTVFDMMQSLRNRFTTFSKAHMLQQWRELSRIKVDMNSNPAVIATRYKRIVDELWDMDVWLDIDTVGPLFFHHAIAQGTPLRTEFNQQIDTAIAEEGYKPISF
jgi:hypothetical protein